MAILHMLLYFYFVFCIFVYSNLRTKVVIFTHIRKPFIKNSNILTQYLHISQKYCTFAHYLATNIHIVF